MGLVATVDAYLAHLKTERRVTEASLRNYRSTCTSFAHWAERRRGKLDSRALQDYVKQFPHPPTANVHLVRLMGLAKFAEIPVKVIRSKEEQREVVALSSTEVEALVREAFKISDDTGHSVRLLSATGLRFGEFVKTGTSRAKMAQGVRYLETGSKRRQRRVPLTEEAYESLARLPFRGAGFEKNFRKALSLAGKRAGIETHVHPHLLRASFISILINERGAQPLHVAQMVGHSSVDTMLHHYAQVSMETLGGLLA